MLTQGEHALDRVGIPGQEWHLKCVRTVLRSQGKYLKKEFVSQNGACPALINRPDATYIIDGILNRRYLMMRKNNGTWKYQKGHDADDTDGSWRHCIVLRGGRIHCAGVHSTGIGVQNLHLDDEGMYTWFFVPACIFCLFPNKPRTS
jgi:hypothetical protein